MSAPKAQAWVLLTTLDPRKSNYQIRNYIIFFDALHEVQSSTMYDSGATLPD